MAKRKKHHTTHFLILGVAAGFVMSTAVHWRFTRLTAQVQSPAAAVLEGDTITVPADTHVNFRCVVAPTQTSVPLQIPEGATVKLYEYTGNELPRALMSDGKPAFDGRKFPSSSDALSRIQANTWYYAYSDTPLLIDCLAGGLQIGNAACAPITCPAPPVNCQWGGGTDERDCPVCGTLLCPQNAQVGAEPEYGLE